MVCSVCGVGRLEELYGFRRLPRVTSDCLPFPSGGRLGMCPRCGAAQSLTDSKHLDELSAIYKKYAIYNQSGGSEQQVFDRAAGSLRPRSEILSERILKLDCAPQTGKILDVGCGSGVTLKAFDKLKGWALYGLDIDDRNRQALRAIDGFCDLYTCSPEEVPEQFNIITLVHSLEHFPNPHEMLSSLRSTLAANGFLFVEVPNAAASPFDYAVADHLTHFTPETLAYLVQRAGFHVRCVATDWVSKEISLVAVSAAEEETPPPVTIAGSRLNVVGQLSWLKAFVAAATTSALATPAGSSFGIFGTSLAAAWLWPAVSERVEFFVEEDPSRIGRTYMGRPILSPVGTPAGTVVFLALMPPMAAAIKARLEALPIDFRMPPPLP